MGIHRVELKEMLNYDLHKLTHQVQQLNIYPFDKQKNCSTYNYETLHSIIYDN